MQEIAGVNLDAGGLTGSVVQCPTHCVVHSDQGKCRSQMAREKQTSNEIHFVPGFVGFASICISLHYNDFHQYYGNDLSPRDISEYLRFAKFDAGSLEL